MASEAARNHSKSDESLAEWFELEDDRAASNSTAPPSEEVSSLRASPAKVRSLVANAHERAYACTDQAEQIFRFCRGLDNGRWLGGKVLASGSLAFSLKTFLQALELEQASGRLEVLRRDFPELGWIEVRQGQVVDAGVHAHVPIRLAVHTILGWEDVLYTWSPPSADSAPDGQALKITQLVTDFALTQDEAPRRLVQIPEVLITPAGSPPAGLTEEERVVLEILEKERGVRDAVVERIGTLEVVTLIYGMFRRGVVAAAS
jgi:hypothetical protein